MPLPNAPEWLTKRDGALAPGLRDFIAFVTISNRPEYKLESRPANGKFTCPVTYTVNGKAIDDAKETYPTADAALAGGLERLRATLGW